MTELLKEMTDFQTLKSDAKKYAAAMAKLAAHPLIRSNNKPQGDIAEAIAAEALGGAFMDQSAKGADIELPNGDLVQVKSVTDYGRRAQTSGIRSTDFDYLLLVIFDPHLGVKSARLYSKAQAIDAMGSLSKHINARTIPINAKPLSLGEDITQKLKAVWY